MSSDSVVISKLHICTWCFTNSKAAVELGIEFHDKKQSEDGSAANKSPTEPYRFLIVSPIFTNKNRILSVSSSLINSRQNCCFIFNDRVTDNHSLSHPNAAGLSDNIGSVVVFENTKKLCILNINKPEPKDGYCEIYVVDPQSAKEKADSAYQGNFDKDTERKYFRVFIETKLENFCIVKTGYTKDDYIYDVKVNEQRNFPENEELKKCIKRNKYSLCKDIERCFCFHIVPSNYTVEYINESKLKNIRMLEHESFNQYIRDCYTDNERSSYEICKGIEQHEYLITFYKSTSNTYISNKYDHSPSDLNKSVNGNDHTCESITPDCYSFFTEYAVEKISRSEIVFALWLNILCGIAFSILSDYEKSLSQDETVLSILKCFILAILVLVLLGMFRKQICMLIKNTMHKIFGFKVIKNIRFKLGHSRV